MVKFSLGHLVIGVLVLGALLGFGLQSPTPAFCLFAVLTTSVLLFGGKAGAPFPKHAGVTGLVLALACVLFISFLEPAKPRLVYSSDDPVQTRNVVAVLAAGCYCIEVVIGYFLWTEYRQKHIHLGTFWMLLLIQGPFIVMGYCFFTFFFILITCG